MDTAAELVPELLTALDGIPGLRAATVAAGTRMPWERTRDATAIDLTGDPGSAGGQLVVVRVVATRLPLAPAVRRAEQALLAVLAANAVPVSRLRLEVTDIDGAAFA
jgi:hypothetical protein